MSTFASWYRQNKDDFEFRELFEEHRQDCRLEGDKVGTFKNFMRDYYEETICTGEE
jgi:hypothetical protein